MNTSNRFWSSISNQYWYYDDHHTIVIKINEELHRKNTKTQQKDNYCNVQVQFVTSFGIYGDANCRVFFNPQWDQPLRSV